MEFYQNYNLKKYNSFKINITAKYFLECRTVKEIQDTIIKREFCENRKLILGGGSNILFTKDFNGFVLKPNIDGIKIVEESDSKVVVKAYCGVIWDDFVKFCISNKYFGSENLSWIPGVVGAVPVQNIGAYGAEAKDIIQKVTAVEISTGNIVEFDNSNCKFGYRESIFKKELKDKYIIVAVDFILSKCKKYNLEYQSLKDSLENKKISLETIRNEIIKIRKSKLPDPREIGNGGSFFKNPVVNKKKWIELANRFPKIPYYKLSDNAFKISAGWLIDKSGLKGYEKGNVGTYPKQALIIVNLGKASGIEIQAFAELIKRKVMEKFSIKLEEEVKII